MDEGFRLLMANHQEMIYSHVRRMVTNHEDAADIVQNVFVSAFKGICRFEAKSALSTWLYRIATNETLTFLRKEKRNAAANSKEEALEHLKAESYIKENDVVRILQKAIDTLPERQKLVFNMRYFDEMSYKEMSQILGVTTGGLKASFHLAVKKVEAFVKENQVL